MPCGPSPPPCLGMLAVAFNPRGPHLVPPGRNLGLFWGQFWSFFGDFGHHFGDFALPGRHCGGLGGHLGTKVVKVTKNMVRGPAPGSPLGHLFGTENDKNHEKVVPEERLERNRKMYAKKTEKGGHLGRAHMQSDHAGAVQTRFSGFRKRRRKASNMSSKMSTFGTFLTIVGPF